MEEPSERGFGEDVRTKRGVQLRWGGVARELKHRVKCVEVELIAMGAGRRLWAIPAGTAPARNSLFGAHGEFGCGEFGEIWW